MAVNSIMLPAQYSWIIIPIAVFLIGTIGLYLRYVKNFAQKKKRSYEAAFRMMNGLIIGSICLLLVVSYAFGAIEGMWTGLLMVFVLLVMSLGFGSFLMQK